MKIADILKPEHILAELNTATKAELLAEMAGVLLQTGAIRQDLGGIVHILLEREKLGTTGIGDGIAIPHGKLGHLENLLVVFGRSLTGVDFEAMDGQPVHLIFLLLAPEHSSGLHLKALAKISRMLKDRVFRQMLMAAASAADLYRIILERDDTC